MALLTDEDLMPWWLAAGLDEDPGVSGTVPEMPAWLLEAPPATGEPPCDCVHCVPPLDVPDQDEPVRWAIPGVWDDEPKPFVVSVGDLVSQLQSLVGRLAAVDPVLLPPGQALGEAEALLGVQQQLRVQQLARTEDVTERRLFDMPGHRSTNTWLRTVAPDADTADCTLARRLAALAHLSAALRAGRVSVAAGKRVAAALVKVRTQLDRPDGLIEHQDGEQVVTAVAWNVIDLICKDRFGLEHDPTSDPAQATLLAALETAVAAILAAGGSQTARVEQAMVLLAHYLRRGSLTDALEELVLQLLPNSLEEHEQTGADKRGLALSPNPDGTWHVEATLTAEVGEQLHTALAAEARRDPANPLDTHAREAARAAQADTDGTDPWAAAMDRPEWEGRALRAHAAGLHPDADQLVPRSRSKRLHDAFGRLVTRYLEQGLGGVQGKVPVQLTATVNERTITGAPGAPPARGASGRPLARSLVKRWWCDAHVTTLVMSRGWKPLGMVHSGRTITGTELKAARVQFDNRCAGDGCCPGTPDPLIPLVPHHVRMHSVYGETTLDDTILACPTLHHDLHTGKRTVRLRDGRRLSEQGFVDTV